MVSDQLNDNMSLDDGGAIPDLERHEQASSPLKMLSNTDILRQVTLILGLAICLAIAVFILLWGKEPDMRPLGTYPTHELIQVLDFMDKEKLPYKLDGNTVIVTAQSYPEIKLALTRSGTVTESAGGEDILLGEGGFGVSQRMEKERLKLSREKQLAHAIEQYTNVSKAKVLLAIPKDNVFARHQRKPSATAVLVVRKGTSLKQEEVDSIVDTIASAVHGLEPSRVTVSDQNGRLLSSGSQDPLASRTRKEFEMQQAKEHEYKQKIDSILAPVLGIGNYTAEVDVKLDFTQSEQTRKTFNPDLPALRSEMTVEDQSTDGTLRGIPGALTNQPPLESDIPEQAAGGGAEQQKAQSGRNHKEATRNYELDTTISHTRRPVGGIERLTVSVAVDYTLTTLADGKVEREPRTQAALETYRRLLKGGLGFDVNRGDTLEVVTIPFNRPDLDPAPELPMWEQPWFWRGARIIGSVLIIAVLIITIVRPMVKRLLYPDAKPEGLAEIDLDNVPAFEGEDDLNVLATQSDRDMEFGIKDGQLQLPDLHRDEDLLKAVRALVANEPEMAAQVIKEWITENE
ncbi:flagellar basal-body MS-ring/collar protein FliF [Dongshaea marina]|uniref:flagellar basal-body MS-ring/collar protein FliF n=1 Tax=Dongshaea marina TaxID=2047966 RepID=UPI000D3E16CD|nr:flagellar basal-body MS-ring/collar protein FliF [Dongshaea marina]